MKAALGIAIEFFGIFLQAMIFFKVGGF